LHDICRAIARIGRRRAVGFQTSSGSGSRRPAKVLWRTMCESKVYLSAAEGEQLVLEDVTTIRPEGDGYRLINLYGEQAHVRGRIKEIDLLKHRIVLESNA